MMSSHRGLWWVLAACAVAALGLGSGAPAWGATTLVISREGTIAAPQDAGPAGFSGVAVDGSTLFAAAPATVGANGNQGAVYVFTKPATGGWSQAAQVATLTPSDGRQESLMAQTLGATGASGSTLAVLTLRRSARAVTPVADVFLQPAGGWSGSVHQAAELSASAGTGCKGLGSPSVLGDDVFVTCVQDLQRLTGLAPSGSLLAFARPAAGWSDARSQSATLVALKGLMLGDVSPVMNGADVFAASVPSSFSYTGPRSFPARPVAVYGFRRPVAGWSGQVRPSTVLSLPANASIIALAGSADHVFVATLTARKVDGEVFAGSPVVYAFARPRHGWSGMITASARLTAPFTQFLPSVSLAAVGDTVVLSDTDLSGEGNQCSCGDQLATFTEPVRGWYGTVAPSAIGGEAADSPGAAASDATTIFILNGTSLDLFPVPPQRSVARVLAPSVAGRLSGVRAGHPWLGLRVAAQAGEPAATSLTLGLPRGLSLSRAAVVTVNGSRARVTGVNARRLTVILPDAQAVDAAVIGRGGLRLSPGLRAAVQRAGRTHPLHRRMTVTITTQIGSRTTRTVSAVVR